MISNALSLADYMSLVNSNPDMISKINKDLVTVYVNDSIWKYSNLPYDFFVGKTVRELAGEGIGQGADDREDRHPGDGRRACRPGRVR